jgi:hypothetical protein
MLSVNITFGISMGVTVMPARHSRSHPLPSLVAVGAAISLLAAYLGFWDYVSPTENQDMCIDVEEGASDLYIAGLALIGGLMTLYGHLRGPP